MVKRYEQGFPEGMDEDIDGDWVRYEDHVAEITRIIAERGHVSQRIVYLNWRQRVMRRLFGWCYFPKCECDLGNGDQKCLRQ